MIQSLLRIDSWRPGAIEEFRNKWMSLGRNFTITEGGHPTVECSGDVVEALDVGRHRLASGAYCEGGNVTKDSLHAELSLDMLLDHCRAQKCRSTEMELSSHHFEMVSVIVGVLPGSFAESKTAKVAVERTALQVAPQTVREQIILF